MTAIPPSTRRTPPKGDTASLAATAKRRVDSTLGRLSFRGKKITPSGALIGLVVFVTISLAVVVLVRAAGPRTRIVFQLGGSRAGQVNQLADGSIKFGAPATSTTNFAAYNNTNPIYSKHATTSAADMPLDQLISGVKPDPTYFKSEATPGRDGDKGEFRTVCDFSHINYDDPILYPGQTDAAHLHVFYGNTDTNASSTASSILNSGGSTCDGFEANRTAYWFPAMFDASGNVHIPNNMIAYYKTEGVPMPAGGYTPIPSGLKMIAGNANATSPQAVGYNNGWGCSSSMFNNPTIGVIPECAPPNKLTLKVAYPRCWDGVNDPNEAYTGKHVVYASAGTIGGTCPADHAKVFPTLSVLFEFELNASTKGWYLASDRHHGNNLPGGTTSHGDWFGGWNPKVMKSWTDGCLNTQWNCQTSLLGNVNTVVPLGAGLIDHLNYTTNIYNGKGPQIIPASAVPSP